MSALPDHIDGFTASNEDLDDQIQGLTIEEPAHYIRQDKGKRRADEPVNDVHASSYCQHDERELQSLLTDGYYTSKKNEELRGTISELIEENEKCQQTLEEQEQELQRTRRKLRDTQSNFDNQEQYVRSAEDAYEKTLEEVERYKQLLRNVRKEAKGLNEELRFRNQTNEDLQNALNGTKETIAAYQLRMDQLDSESWVLDVDAWRRNLEDEKEILCEMLFRVVRNSEEMVSLFPSNLQSLDDRMLLDPAGSANESAEGSWRPYYQANALRQVLSHGRGESVGDLDNTPKDTLRPTSEDGNQPPYPTLQEELQNLENQNSWGMEEESESEYEPPETIHPSPAPLPPEGDSELKKGILDRNIQLPMEKMDLDQDGDGWFHMSGTSSQDARTSGTSQNGVSQPMESCLSTMNCELTQAIQEIVERVMSDVETARCKWDLVQRMDIDFVQLIRKRPRPLEESVLLRKKNIIQQEQKKLRWKRSVQNDTLPDEWLALFGFKATPENKFPPDPLFPNQVTANMLNFVVPPVTFPTATPAPPSQPLANPIESKNASAGPKNEDKKNVPRRFRSLRPKQAGVIYFSRKTKATARQRPPTPRGRPILDLRRIKVSPSLQLAGFQADHDAAVAEDPSILAMRYDISHFYMNVNDELAPIQGPYIYVEGKIAQEIEEPAKQGYDPGWHNPSPISSSSSGVKWWLLLFCVAILWCMWPSGETNKKRWKEANEVPEDLHTRLKENRNSEFEFIQMLAYEMAMRSDFDLVMMG